jgi:RHS repeat-associated protein
LTSAGSTTYAYSSENRLISASGGITLAYDPLGRLFQISGGSAGITRFLYDGDALIGEYDGSNAMLRRYAHGPGADEPLVWYEGSNFQDRRFLHADERGSIVALTNANGTVLWLNTYDEYGIPGADNVGRFQYTGQTWLPELGMYYYKARIYSPTLGRFLQTDPIGYGDGMNLYAYVGNDPVNATDPSGTCTFVNYSWYRASNNQYLGPAGVEFIGCNNFFVGFQPTSYFGGDSGGGGEATDEQDCKAGGDVTISRRGNRITITGKINFTGEGSNPTTNQAYLNALNSQWSGTFGPPSNQYVVTTSIMQGTGGITAQISGATSGVSASTNRIGGSVMNLLGLPGGAYNSSNFTQIAHEFGHVLRAIDRYNAITLAAFTGYEKNIMSNRPNTKVDERTIGEVLEKCTPE